MGKPQITVRISPALLNSLNQCVESTGTLKTDVVISEISQYLGCADQVSINQRIADLENKVTKLEFEVRGQTINV